MNNLQDRVPVDIQQDFAQLNQQLTNHLTSSIALVQDIKDYVLRNGGKRIRPLLTLLIAKGFAYSGKQHITLGCIVEYIHTATLLHDDILDDASFRRSQPTINKKWGNTPAVLIGDYFYTQAFLLIASLNNSRITQVFARTNALIIEGELLQLTEVANIQLSQLQYLRIIYRKTAVLFAVAARVMAILANKTPEQQSAIAHYARCLGMAFQIIDDWLDYAGEAKQTGKQPGKDLAEKKLTLPLIHAFRTGSPAEIQILKQALAHHGSADPVQFNQVKHILERTGSLDYTKTCAAYYAQRAVYFLEQVELADKTMEHYLQQIAVQLLERAY